MGKGPMEQVGLESGLSLEQADHFREEMTSTVSQR